MSDDEGFDFRPPPPRREARQFEPPPWERDAFEKLARERQEQQRIEREAAEAAAQVAAQVAAQQAAVAGADPAAAPEAVPAAVPEGVPGQPAVEPTPAPKRELDEKQVELMMMELKAEEEPALQGAWKVGLGSGAVLVLVGMVVVVWGFIAVANRRLGATGVLGGSVMVVFGFAAFVGGGFLILRALRQRGVL